MQLKTFTARKTESAPPRCTSTSEFWPYRRDNDEVKTENNLGKIQFPCEATKMQADMKFTDTANSTTEKLQLSLSESGFG